MSTSGGSSGGGPSPSDTVVGPDAFSDAANAGTSAEYSRGDHNHGLPAAPAGGTPSDTVVADTTFGLAAAAGVATAYSRGDHTHGSPAAPAVPTAATTVTGPDAYGAAAVVGVATTYARADHDHGLPAAPAVPSASGTVGASTSFGQASNAGAATTYSRGDHVHGTPAAPSVPAAASTVTGPDTYGKAPAVGTSADYARADHDHGLPAAPAASLSTDSGNLAADIHFTNTTLTTILTTGSLTVGTWLVRGAVTLLSDSPAASWAVVTMAAGTATATFAGQQTAQHTFVALESNTLTVECLVTVTVAGTLVVQSECGASGITAKAASSGFTGPKATGWTAVKVA